MTRAEILSLVQTNIGNRTDKNTLIYSAIDFAQRDIARCGQLFRSLHQSFSTSITTGDSVIALPAYTRHIIEIRLQDSASTTSYPLCLKPKIWVMKRYPNPSADPQSKPDIAYIENGSLYFVPYSNGDYTIAGTVYCDPAPFTDSSQSVAVDGSEDAIVAYCTAYVYRSIQQFDAANQWQANYIQLLERLKVEDRRSPGVDFSQDSFGDGTTNKSLASYWLNPFIGHDTDGWV
jgi:hypothetical protein